MDGGPRFWLEFQVVSDGAGPPAAPAGPGRLARFPDLPAELRLQIWALALAPRVVAVACVDAADPAAGRAHLARRPRRPPTPALLHASREARALALARYAPALSWRVPRTLADAWATAAAAARRDPLEERRLLLLQRAAAAAAWSPPRVWFDYERDALLLVGELEPRDPDGFNTPACYFLRQEEAERVRRVACAFESLPCGQFQDEMVFGTLFHIMDRFCSSPRRRKEEEGREAAGGGRSRRRRQQQQQQQQQQQRLIVTVRAETRREDEKPEAYDPFCADTMPSKRRRMLPEVLPSRDNPVAKVWRQWMSGTHTMTLERKETEIIMVEEERLAEFIAELDALEA